MAMRSNPHLRENRIRIAVLRLDLASSQLLGVKWSMSKKEIYRIVTRGQDGSMRIRDFHTAENILATHSQIGTDESRVEEVCQPTGRIFLESSAILARGTNRLPTRLSP